MNTKRLRLLAFLALMLWALPCFSQISVASFQLLENDMTANTAGTMKKDQNGKTCALIKVVTSETGFNFDVGMLGVTATEQHTGEIWVYVPEKVRFITIAHQQLGTLRQYALPQQVASGRTYELKLTTGKVRTIVEEAQTDQFVVFHIVPADAILEFDGEPLALDADGSASCFKPFGKYNYRIERADYHTEVGVVNVSQEKATVDVRLRPKFGWLTVGSEVDGTDADVYVDGRHFGNLPMPALQLSSGNHQLKIIKPLYKTFQQSVKITDNDTLHVDAALKSNYRNYTINGDDEADIYINQEYKGHGTWTGPLVSGTYRIELRRESHRTSSRSVTIKANDTSMNDVITMPAPTPIYGSLKITSTPINAEVKIDGKPVGKTPLFVKDVLIGKRDVTLSHDGYRTETVSATVQERRTSDVNVSMNNIVNVKFTSNVPATVTVDGKFIGRTPCDARLTCTGHEVSMSADRCMTRTESVNISDSSPIIHWELAPNFRTLHITSNLSDVTYYVDGKNIGEGRQVTAEIEYGVHTVKAVYYDKAKEETITVSEGADNYLEFSFRKKKNREDHIHNNAFYIGVFYQPFNFTGVGVEMGAYSANFNYDISFVMPYKSTVSYVTDYGSAKTVENKLVRCDVNLGWGIHCGKMVRITPRFGASFITNSSSDYKAPMHNYATALKPSIRFSFVYKKLSINVSPEYYIPVWQKDEYKEISDQYDKYEKAIKGFNLQAGVALIF